MAESTIYKYLVFSVGMSLFLAIAGLPTLSNFGLKTIGVDLNIEDPKLSTFQFELSNWTLAITAILSLVGTGILIAVGLARGLGGVGIALTAAFAGTLVVYSADIVALAYTILTNPNVSNWIGLSILAISVPIAAGYLFAIIDWWSSKS